MNDIAANTTAVALAVGVTAFLLLMALLGYIIRSCNKDVEAYKYTADLDSPAGSTKRRAIKVLTQDNAQQAARIKDLERYLSNTRSINDSLRKELCEIMQVQRAERNAPMQARQLNRLRQQREQERANANLKIEALIARLDEARELSNERFRETRELAAKAAKDATTIDKLERMTSNLEGLLQLREAEAATLVRENKQYEADASTLERKLRSMEYARDSWLRTAQERGKTIAELKEQLRHLQAVEDLRKF